MPYLACGGHTAVGAIAENLVTVQERIARAAGRSGRAVEDVTLVVVTKAIEVSRIREAIAAGAADVGESQVHAALGILEYAQAGDLFSDVIGVRLAIPFSDAEQDEEAARDFGAGLAADCDAGG